MTKPLPDLAKCRFYRAFARLREILTLMKWQMLNTYHNGVLSANNLPPIKMDTLVAGSSPAGLVGAG